MRNATAVICEFNPIHRGHRHLLKLAGAGGERVLCVMSGHFTQRGIPALFDKYARAEAAVRCGADLVVELPWPWCSSGAEDFARGGCAVAAGMGADSLTFGSETADVEMLTRGAAVRGSSDYAERIRAAERTFRDGGGGVLFERVMGELGVVPGGGNDRLGIEYIRFGRAAGIGSFRPVRRAEGFPSAAELRRIFRQGGMEALLPLLAEEGVLPLTRAEICREEEYERMLFAHARLSLPLLIDTDPGGEGNELLRYAARAARDCSDAGAFMERLPTKKYTASRLRRELLRSAVGAGESGEDPRFTVLLAAGERGREWLSERRREGGIPVIVKPADTSSLDETGARQYAVHRRADEVYTFLTGREAGFWMKQSPRML